jgi:hypothetical protein
MSERTQADNDVILAAVERIATHTWVLAVLAAVSFLFGAVGLIVIAIYAHRIDYGLNDGRSPSAKASAECWDDPAMSANDCRALEE